MRNTILAVSIATALAATSLAFAAPGGGYGPGAGNGPGCVNAGQGCGFGPGAGGGRGAGYGAGYGGGLMTDEERTAHREAMHSFKSVDECKAYWTQHRAAMTARAQQQDITPGPGPRGDPCERMAARGFFN